jgi:hypothetical protein
MRSYHQFSPDPTDPRYCRCGLAKDDVDHEAPALPPAAVPLASDPTELRRRILTLLSNVGEKARCKGCMVEIWWVRHSNGKQAPYTAEGLNHFIDCPNRDQFRKSAR